MNRALEGQVTNFSAGRGRWTLLILYLRAHARGMAVQAGSKLAENRAEGGILLSTLQLAPVKRTKCHLSRVRRLPWPRLGGIWRKDLRYSCSDLASERSGAQEERSTKPSRRTRDGK